MKKHEAQVLIAGAGPVGLATALALTERGISVAIVDPRERSSTHDYACILQRPTVQDLRKIGLDSTIFDKGIDLTDFVVRIGETASTVPTGKAAPLVLGQMVVESALEAALKERGVKVQRGFRLARFEQSATGVTCEVDELETCLMGYAVAHTEKLVRRKHTYSARILIGADGRGSLVRSQLSIPFDSYAPTSLYRVAEMVTTAAVEPTLHISRQGKATHGLFPLSNNRVRVCIDLEDGPEGSYPLEKPESWIDLSPCKCGTEELAYWMAVKFPIINIDLDAIEWCRLIRFDRRIAARFSSGNALLLGDAAYIDTPLGAPGLNCGIQTGCAIARTLEPSSPMETIHSTLQSIRNLLVHRAEVSAKLTAEESPTADMIVESILADSAGC